MSSPARGGRVPANSPGPLPRQVAGRAGRLPVCPAATPTAIMAASCDRRLRRGSQTGKMPRRASSGTGPAGAARARLACTGFDVATSAIDLRESGDGCRQPPNGIEAGTGLLGTVPGSRRAVEQRDGKRPRNPRGTET